MMAVRYTIIVYVSCTSVHYSVPVSCVLRAAPPPAVSVCPLRGLRGEELGRTYLGHKKY